MLQSDLPKEILETYAQIECCDTEYMVKSDFYKSVTRRCALCMTAKKVICFLFNPDIKSRIVNVANLHLQSTS